MPQHNAISAQEQQKIIDALGSYPDSDRLLDVARRFNRSVTTICRINWARRKTFARFP